MNYLARPCLHKTKIGASWSSADEVFPSMQEAWVPSPALHKLGLSAQNSEIVMAESIVQGHSLLHSEFECRLRDKRQTHRQGGREGKGGKRE